MTPVFIAHIVRTVPIGLIGFRRVPRGALLAPFRGSFLNTSLISAFLGFVRALPRGTAMLLAASRRRCLGAHLYLEHVLVAARMGSLLGEVWPRELCTGPGVGACLVSRHNAARMSSGFFVPGAVKHQLLGFCWPGSGGSFSPVEAR